MLIIIFLSVLWPDVDSVQSTSVSTVGIFTMIDIFLYVLVVKMFSNNKHMYLAFISNIFVISIRISGFTQRDEPRAAQLLTHITNLRSVLAGDDSTTKHPKDLQMGGGYEGEPEECMIVKG